MMLHHISSELMNLARSYSPVLPAIAAILLLAACVDLTPSWSGQRDAGKEAGHHYEYRIGSTTYSVTQTGPSASTFPGYALASGGDAGTAGAGNYVVFHNVTGSSFTLTAQPRASTWGMERAPVNGIQVVYPSGS